MNCPLCGKRLSMARKWKNKERVISRGVDGEVVSVFEPGEIIYCPSDGCKFKVFSMIPSTELSQRIKTL